MRVLTIRTDKPEAEIGLYDDDKQVAYITWEAHRQLAETIHKKIVMLLEERAVDLSDLEGVIVFEGPGSFTGLRIGITVGNALAYSLNIPIVGVQTEDTWIERGLQRLTDGENQQRVIPFYGAPVHITPPKK